MTDKNWRFNLDMVIEQNLVELIKETKEYDDAISQAKDKSKAQLWVALAIINNKLKNLEISEKKYDSKIPKQELKDILDTLEKL